MMKAEDVKVGARVRANAMHGTCVGPIEEIDPLFGPRAGAKVGGLWFGLHEMELLEDNGLEALEGK